MSSLIHHQLKYVIFHPSIFDIYPVQGDSGAGVYPTSQRAEYTLDSSPICCSANTERPFTSVGKREATQTQREYANCTKNSHRVDLNLELSRSWVGDLVF